MILLKQTCRYVEAWLQWIIQSVQKNPAHVPPGTYFAYLAGSDSVKWRNLLRFGVKNTDLNRVTWVTECFVAESSTIYVFLILH